MKPKHMPSFIAFSSLSHIMHHGEEKFVVLSYSNDPVDPLREHLPHLNSPPEPESTVKCVIFEVGEVGGANRWWCGMWTLDDVGKIAGTGGKEEAYCNIINNAARQFIEGNLSIADLPTAGGHSQTHSTQTQETTQMDSRTSVTSAGPSLRIDSTTDILPLKIPLHLLPASHATQRGNQILSAIITEISLNHSARLFPPSITSGSRDGDAGRSDPFSISPRRGQDDVKSRKKETELEKQVQYLENELKKHDQEVIAPPPAIQPGRSLGNPTKKARKVQAVEFDDDESTEERAPEAKNTKRRKRT